MVCPKAILLSGLRCISLQYCLSNEGKLVEPATQSDIHSMNRFISNQQCLKSCYYWMGITDIYSEGNFTFASSGCRATVFNWTSGKICLCIKKWRASKKKCKVVLHQKQCCHRQTDSQTDRCPQKKCKVVCHQRQCCQIKQVCRAKVKKNCLCIKQLGRERETERERQRERQRQTERQRQRHIERLTERKRERNRDCIDRQTDTQTDRQTDREAQRKTKKKRDNERKRKGEMADNENPGHLRVDQLV